MYTGRYTVSQGHGNPLAHEEISHYHQINPNTMGGFYSNLFAGNRSSPYCSSTLSTSTGQVCTTPAQSKFIAVHRGGNKHYYDDSF